MGLSNEADVLSNAPLDRQKPGSFYGNIGRCFYLQEELDKALICYKKSAQLLEVKLGDLMNSGYIRYWVAQALMKKNRIEESLYFYLAAIGKWKGLVPSRAETIETEMEQLFEQYPDLERVKLVASWRIENRFTEWMNS